MGESKKRHKVVFPDFGFLCVLKEGLSRLHYCGIGFTTERMNMQALIYSDEMIEAMVDAMCGKRASDLDRDAYRQALRGLVRLGQAEQLLSMQLDFEKMTNPPGFYHQ